MNKKIICDLAFIYIEWQLQDFRERFLKCDDAAQKTAILDSVRDDQCRDIFLNFFIKLAFNNNLEKEEKEVLKKNEGRFVVLDSKPEYVIDKINNG